MTADNTSPTREAIISLSFSKMAHSTSLPLTPSSIKILESVARAKVIASFNSVSLFTLDILIKEALNK